MALTKDELSEKTCAQLRKMLKAAGLDTKGKKSIIVQRLIDAQEPNEDGADSSNEKVEHRVEDTERPQKGATTKGKGPEKKAKKESAKRADSSRKEPLSLQDPSTASEVDMGLPVAGLTIPLPMNTTVSVSRDKVQGRTASGRFWKSVQTRKKSGRTDAERQKLWKEKMEAKARFKAMKQYEQDMKDRRQQEIDDRRQKMIEKKKRKAEGALRSSRFQTISSGDKLKKMSKKQLRQVKKMQMNPYLGVVEYVSAFGRSSHRSGRDLKRVRR